MEHLGIRGIRVKLTVVRPLTMASLATEQEGSAVDGTGKPLSSRERQLMTLAAQGETDDGIAHKIGIARGTIATYWTRIRAKMGPHNRVELVARFLQAHEESVIAELNAEIQRLKGTVEHIGDEGPQEVGFFRALLEESPDVVLVVDSDNRIAFANHAAQHFLGYSEDEFIGLALQTLLPERYHGIHKKHVAEYRRKPTSR